MRLCLSWNPCAADNGKDGLLEVHARSLKNLCKLYVHMYQQSAYPDGCYVLVSIDSVLFC